MQRPRTILVRNFIIHQLQVEAHDIAKVIAEKFGISIQAARGHLKALEQEGVITSSGRTKSKTYSLAPLAKISTRYKIADLQEDVVWLQDFRPSLRLNENIDKICSIAFSEMLNNAIDHSGSDEVYVEMLYTAGTISFTIQDFGVGIFRKIRNALNLPDDRMAILELSKGKVTTAPSEHTGYGIYFTSRMVDLFTLQSGSLLFSHIQSARDWLIDTNAEIAGTTVHFSISTSSERTAEEVYNEYCSDPEDANATMDFRKTHVPIRLAQGTSGWAAHPSLNPLRRGIYAQPLDLSESKSRH